MITGGNERRKGVLALNMLHKNGAFCHILLRVDTDAHI
jgi:hypothetical protein